MWLLLSICILSVSPASLPIGIGAALELHRLAARRSRFMRSHATAPRADGASEAPSLAATAWFVFGAAVGLATLGSTIVCVVAWAAEVGAFPLKGSRTATLLLVHWLLVTSATLLAALGLLTRRRGGGSRSSGSSSTRVMEVADASL